MNNKKAFFLTILLSALFASPSYALYTLPNFECTLTDNGNAEQYPYDGNDAGYFYKYHTKAIYLICDSNTVSRNDSIRAVWIHEGPTGYHKIEEKKVVIRHNLDDLDIFKTRFMLSNCDHELPLGKYHVRLYINGVEGNAYYFTIR